MTDSSVDLGNIPTIGSSQPILKDPKNSEKPDVAMFDNAPNDVTVWWFFGRVFIWFIVGLCVAALLFWVLTAFGWITWSSNWKANSMLNFLLPVVWLVVSFVWSFALALMYNIFFNKKYYNLSKMFGLIFASSLIIFVFFFFLYLFYTNVGELYVLLWFQIIFWLYITLNLMDFLSQPNYSASSLLGNTLWAIMSVVAYIWLMRLFVWSSDNSGELKYYFFLVIISVIFSYVLTSFGSSIRDAIYYKFYEWWNNPFYLPSLNELREERQKEEKEKEKEEEEVNVEVW